jgi:uncharacterized LabA/DUF88 family protein
MEERIIRNQRVAILVDAANIFMRCLETGIRLDYSRVIERLNSRQILRCIFYHVEIDATREAGFIQKIRSMGYEVKTKQLKVYPDGTRKADMDVDLTIDAVCLADKVDVICIVSCDGDYVPLVYYLKSRGLKAEAMGFERCTSHRLKEAVDEFYPITEDMLMKPALDVR